MIYIAGPMTGIPDHNLPAFAEAAMRLRMRGHVVLNPGRHGAIPGHAWADYMRDALRELVDCDAVALLPGWRYSRGAYLEHQVAVALGMDVRDLAMWLEQEVTL